MLQLPETKQVPVGEIMKGLTNRPPAARAVTCSVLKLSLQYDQLIEKWECADNHVPGDAKSTRLMQQMHKLALRASYMSAESYEGAVFQVMLASSRLDGIRTSTTAEDRREQEELADRLLYRAMHRFGRNDRDVSPRLREYLMPAHCDQRELGRRRAR